MHLLGAVSYEELPSYFTGFDCGMIPYLINDFTNYTFPSKMAEYLAAGLPVVSTPLPELARYSDVVSIVRSPQEMISTIRDHLSDPNKDSSKQKRIDVACTLSWESIVSQMEALLEQAVNRGVQLYPSTNK